MGSCLAARNPATSLDETVEAAAQVRWWISQSQPVVNGSSSLGDTIVYSIFDARGISTGPLRQNVALDLEAIVTPLDEFVDDFGDFYTQTPSL